ncbi:LPXTG cell wall anchor domain-containing protein [Actinoplanes oblitus]|uniref:LPXTG cell wall anchor domain-containing protein n=1 Tax=Actinoplanes oblitus TaxID=3040509 RepID=A0ABY8WW83_9ACTN|nr:LPXTG cell wall anchor domain-containing protein [Actinoplanes oblitus]WIN00860.1 LPXTG cell wall anchor domain-containing protein [Actinoplanes oblitus]
MRGKTSAGVLVALAFLIPAAPAVAQVEPSGLDQACQTADRKVFKDLRTIVTTIDLDTATDTEVRLRANQIMAAARAESLPVLPTVMQQRLDGTADDLRAFLKTDLRSAWLTDLRVSVLRTLTDAGENVQAAAKKALDAGTIDDFLTYLNDGLYAARALDCAAQPTSSPSATPSASASVTPVATASTGPSASSTASTGPSASSTASTGAGASGGEDGEGDGLPVTGAATGTVAGIGGALLLLGGAGYLIGRRRRSRFVA